MRLKKWKSFSCICTSCTLLTSMAVSASPAAITPSEESQVSSFQSGNRTSDQGMVSSRGLDPESGGGRVVISSDEPSSSGSPSPSGNPPLSGSPSTSGSPSPSGSPSTLGSPSTSGTPPPSKSPSLLGSPSQSPSTSQAVGTFDQTATAFVQKLEIISEGAVLMDTAMGTVLFSKNGDKQFYPTSIIKLMTALLVAENCSLDDKVIFSATATTNLEVDAVSINMMVGDMMTVRQCLYALLLKSASEVGDAPTEHVAGSSAKFAEMMNAKAAALGCTNIHFTSPHSLNDSNRYTTPHDMALIAGAASQNDVVKTVASTRMYTLPATIKNSSGLTMITKRKILNLNDARYYPGIIGGRTGHTPKAGDTLVTAVERDEVRLIAVVMKSKSIHYTDTKTPFGYGYELVKAGALNDSAGSIGSSDDAGTIGNPSGMGNAGPGTSPAKGWVQDSSGWYYVKDNGAKAANEWVTADGVPCWIDSDTYMAKGWRQVNGKWYSLRSDGAMARNQWEKAGENGQWFYLGTDSVILTNTAMPDGSRVNENGAWVQ